MSGLFKQPAPPQVAVAPPMPSPTDPAVIEAANQSSVAAMQRAGRASTVLGQQGGPQSAPQAPPTAAADAYSGSKLGS